MHCMSYEYILYYSKLFYVTLSFSSPKNRSEVLHWMKAGLIIASQPEPHQSAMISKKNIDFAHKLERFLQHIVRACSSPGQSSLRQLDRAGPEVITKSPILRDRSSCLNIELVDRGDTKLAS